MAIEVFNRYENKYKLNAQQFEEVCPRLLEFMEPDAYNEGGEFYSICNVYYDTEDDLLIRTSLSKPRYKEKLRIRSYGVPDENSLVYLELKKKVNGLVNKRRTAVTLEEARDFVRDGGLQEIPPYANRQVVGEISYFLQSHQLQPAVYLAYDRMAFFERGNPDLRISFDCNIRTRRTALRLEDGDYGDALLEEGQYLMEVKTSRAIPVWLSKILTQYRIFSTSFSKYGTEYKQHMLNNQNREEKQCWTSYSKQQQSRHLPSEALFLPY